MFFNDAASVKSVTLRDPRRSLDDGPTKRLWSTGVVPTASSRNSMAIQPSTRLVETDIVPGRRLLGLSPQCIAVFSSIWTNAG